jgi:hypothetical protein
MLARGSEGADGRAGQLPPAKLVVADQRGTRGATRPGVTPPGRLAGDENPCANARRRSSGACSDRVGPAGGYWIVKFRLRL